MNHCVDTFLMLMLSTLFLIGSSCHHKRSINEEATSQQAHISNGHIQRLDPRINDLIPLSSEIEILAEGFEWSEGPLWIEDGDYLLFSDVPRNTIYKWSESEGATVFLHPSGYTGSTGRGGEPGSNGLLLDHQGSLVLCQHGDRRLARMLGSLAAPQSAFETIVDRYEGLRFNSPNDAVYDQQGNLYFTDPPYGLEGHMEDPEKEIQFQGVYRLSNEGVLNLIADDLPRPNGIAISADQSTLYVSNSEGAPMWTKFILSENGAVVSREILYHGKDAEGLGAPDGMRVDSQGYIWATGPGGVWIMDPQGTVLGKVITGQRTSNCAFDASESYLYMTCDDYLMRIRLR